LWIRFSCPRRPREPQLIIHLRCIYDVDIEDLVKSRFLRPTMVRSRFCRLTTV
jgi:hypothetical protein